MRKKRRAAAAVLTVVLAGGILTVCNRKPTEGIDQAWTSVREAWGDTVLVSTIRGSIWRDTLTLTPELSIGVLDGDDAYLLGDVAGLDVDAQGRLYAVDRQAQNLRVFSAQGEHLVTIGRGGEGPGEFSRPDCGRVTDDGRIVVRDAPWRFSVFSKEGEYGGGWLLLSGFSTSEPFYFDAHERVLNPTLPGALVRYDLEGSVVDTVPEPSRGYAAPRLEVTTENGRASYSIPFMPSERWTMTREGRFLSGRRTSTGSSDGDPMERSCESSGRLTRFQCCRGKQPRPGNESPGRFGGPTTPLGAGKAQRFLRTSHLGSQRSPA